MTTLSPGQAEKDPEVYVGHHNLQCVVEGPEESKTAKQQHELEEEEDTGYRNKECKSPQEESISDGWMCW